MTTPTSPMAVPDTLGPSGNVQRERDEAREKAAERNEKREDKRSRNRYYAEAFPNSPLAKPR